MRLTPYGWWPVCVAALALSVVPAWGQAWMPAGLQGGNYRLGSWSAELGLDYMSGESSTSAAGSATSRTASAGYGESLRIGNSGFYVLNPRLFRGGLSVNLMLNHDHSEGAGEPLVSQGKALGYAFEGIFLSEKPYPISIYATKNQQNAVQPSGGLVQGINSNRGISFDLHPDSILSDWGYPWTEGHLNIRSEDNQTSNSSFGRTSTSVDQSQELELSISKGFETADLLFNYRLNDRKNPLFSQSNFSSLASNVAYSLDFGPGLNRSFDTSWSYASGSGATPSTSINNSDHLHIAHSKGLQTDYTYGFSRQTLGTDVTTMQLASAALQHQLYKNLSSNLSVKASNTTLPNGTMTTSGLQLGESYSHSLPAKGSFNASWSGSQSLSSNRLSSSSINVVEEPHTATSPLSVRTGFLLGHQFAARSSLVVLDVNAGDRRLLHELTDYEVVVESNDIRIIALPTALPSLEGHALVVSYVYQVDPSLDSQTRTSGFGLGVNYQWVGVSYQHSQSGQTALNQTTSAFLQDSVQDTVQINLRGLVLKMDSNAQLTLEKKTASDTENRQTKFNAGSQWDVNPGLRLTMNLQASQATYTRPDQHVTVTLAGQGSVMIPGISMTLGLNSTNSNFTWPEQRSDSLRGARGSLNWMTAGGWINSATLDWSTHAIDPAPPENLFQLLAQTSVTRGKLSLSASLGWGRWTRADSRSTNRSLNLSAVRQL